MSNILHILIIYTFELVYFIVVGDLEHHLYETEECGWYSIFSSLYIMLLKFKIQLEINMVLYTVVMLCQSPFPQLNRNGNTIDYDVWIRCTSSILQYFYSLINFSKKRFSYFLWFESRFVCILHEFLVTSIAETNFTSVTFLNATFLSVQ